jgi:cytochrome P450
MPPPNSSSATAATFAAYDPLAPQVRADPYPYYRYLRANEPVKYVESMNAYAVSRHDDVRKVLLDHEGFSSDPLIQIAFSDSNPAPDAQYLISADPPDHTRLRALVNKAFSRRMLTEMHGGITATVERLLDGVAGRDEFDLVEDFSSPLPVSVIGAILGVEASMSADFRRWSNNVTAGGDAHSLSEARRSEMQRDAVDFRNYFLERIAAARAKPENNLISALVEAEEQGQKLSADEVLALCVLLLIAGNETTTSLLGNALVCLREFPDQEKLIRANRQLIPNFIEESLRYLSPVQLLFRRATADSQIAGVAIPKDSIVMPMYASANRDDAVFENPDVLDVNRAELRKHVAFSWGIHMCVGRALTAFEGEIALNALFDRYPTLEIASSSIEWCDAFYLRGPKNLLVHCR